MSTIQEDITQLIAQQATLLATITGLEQRITDRVDALLASVGADGVTLAIHQGIGDDATATGTVSRPYQTLTALFDAAKDASSIRVQLMSPINVTEFHRITAQYLTFTSDQERVRRKMSFGGQALNPKPNGETGLAGFSLRAGTINLLDVNVELPDIGGPIDGQTGVFILSEGGHFVYREGFFSALTSGTAAHLVQAAAPSPLGVWTGSTFTRGSETDGKVIAEISAGADPNADASNRFRSNLTAV